VDQHHSVGIRQEFGTWVYPGEYKSIMTQMKFLTAWGLVGDNAVVVGQAEET